MCDGKSVFEYRHQDKHLVERPIPKELQGQSIVDGPLPFLFGAEAAKLKARYWLRIAEHPAIRFVRFRPPKLERTAEGVTLSLPHIRLDRALQFLIGDRLA